MIVGYCTSVTSQVVETSIFDRLITKNEQQLHIIPEDDSDDTNLINDHTPKDQDSDSDYSMSSNDGSDEFVERNYERESGNIKSNHPDQIDTSMRDADSIDDDDSNSDSNDNALYIGTRYALKMHFNLNDRVDVDGVKINLEFTPKSYEDARREYFKDASAETDVEAGKLEYLIAKRTFYNLFTLHFLSVCGSASEVQPLQSYTTLEDLKDKYSLRRGN